MFFQILTKEDDMCNFQCDIFYSTSDETPKIKKKVRAPLENDLVGDIII